MQLRKLLENLEIEEITGELGAEITDVCFDSSRVRQGSLFVCLSGSHFDGHSYAEAAAERGAAAVLTERRVPVSLPQIRVKSTRCALSKVCSNFYGNPEKKLRVVTVTGTNGKTSITYILRSILRRAGIKCGLIGTLGTMIGEKRVPSGLTTPDPTELYKLLSDMVSQGVSVCVMEASAHAIYLEKLCGLRAEVGIFTNFSQDHLDYFRTLEEYAKVKKGYFTPENCKYALINADDPVGLEIIRESDCEILTYGERNPSDIFGMDFANTKRGMRYIINAFDEVCEITCGLYGRFNMYNSMAAAGAARILGVSLKCAAEGIAALSRVDGRFNVLATGKGYSVIIDYAHTPDGLKNVLSAAREMCKGRVLLVFGCGGNRDRTKRPLMGKVASELADFCVITSDNPRFEDPFEIMREIEQGMRRNESFYIMVENRARAIACALAAAGEGDVVLICGKGGEEFQEIAGIQHKFSDEETVKALLGQV